MPALKQQLLDRVYFSTHTVVVDFLGRVSCLSDDSIFRLLDNNGMYRLFRRADYGDEAKLNDVLEQFVAGVTAKWDGFVDILVGYLAAYCDRTDRSLTEKQHFVGGFLAAVFGEQSLLLQYRRFDQQFFAAVTRELQQFRTRLFDRFYEGQLLIDLQAHKPKKPNKKRRAYQKFVREQAASVPDIELMERVLPDLLLFARNLHLIVSEEYDDFCQLSAGEAGEKCTAAGVTLVQQEKIHIYASRIPGYSHAQRPGLSPLGGIDAERFGAGSSDAGVSTCFHEPAGREFFRATVWRFGLKRIFVEELMDTYTYYFLAMRESDSMLGLMKEQLSAVGYVESAGLQQLREQLVEQIGEWLIDRMNAYRVVVDKVLDGEKLSKHEQNVWRLLQRFIKKLGLELKPGRYLSQTPAHITKGIERVTERGGVRTTWKYLGPTKSYDCELPEGWVVGVWERQVSEADLTPHVMAEILDWWLGQLALAVTQVMRYAPTERVSEIIGKIPVFDAYLPGGLTKLFPELSDALTELCAEAGSEAMERFRLLKTLYPANGVSPERHCLAYLPQVSGLELDGLLGRAPSEAAEPQLLLAPSVSSETGSSWWLDYTETRASFDAGFWVACQRRLAELVGHNAAHWFAGKHHDAANVRDTVATTSSVAGDIATALLVSPEAAALICAADEVVPSAVRAAVSFWGASPQTAEQAGTLSGQAARVLAFGWACATAPVPLALAAAGVGAVAAEQLCDQILAACPGLKARFSH